MKPVMGGPGYGNYIIVADRHLLQPSFLLGVTSIFSQVVRGTKAKTFKIFQQQDITHNKS